MFQSISPRDEPVVYLSSPKFDPTAPGADGLVVYGADRFRFRLWEVKKSNAQVSATLSKAYKQLSAEGDVYLAQLTAVAQEEGRPDLVGFFSQLLDFWLDGTTEATAGVAVATPATPVNCFTTMRARLPTLAGPDAHRGLLISIRDYPRFCRDIRDKLWSGL